MPPQELAIAMPTTEEMTRIGAVGVGAGATGVVEGFIVSLAPKLGALELPFTWGTLLGIPAVGVAGALLAPKGIISDMALGVAAGGLGYLGATIPAMLQEFTLARPRGGGQGQLGAGSGVKQLGAGPLGAASRAQHAGARVGLDF